MEIQSFAVVMLLFMMNTQVKAQTSGGGAAAQATPPAYHFSSVDMRTVIPFELTSDGIFFHLQIAGSSGQLWFSLDTGAGSSYLDSGVAKRLGLQTSGSGSVHGAGAGAVPVNFVESVTFELAGLTSSGHRVNTTDLTALQGHHPMDGFLGYDFISRYVITLDYAARKMTIADPSVFSYSGAGGVFPIKFRGKWPYIEGTIAVPGAKPERGEFLVDSGSGDAVDDPTILKTTSPTRKVKTGVGLGQAGEGVLGRASYLQLGSFRLEAPTAACCSGNPDDMRKIGTEVLRRFTVILDYKRNRMILEPNIHFKDTFPDA
ncbi:MAG TPA: retropepsin-like aspartic protease [Candidatus Sulfotelmatobacter sp.]|nr:retropepsin-like aspartic protease [Candidatus Sulfotelmatobacter sp.]